MAKQSEKDQLLALINKITEQPEAIPGKARAREIEKAIFLLDKGQDLINQAMLLLAGNPNENKTDEYMANEAMFTFAPFGRKADGTPKKASGKGVGNDNDKKLREMYPQMFEDAAIDPSHGGSNKPTAKSVGKRATVRKL